MPKPIPVTALMEVTPNPVPLGTVYKVSASGLTPGFPVNFVLDGVATYDRVDEEGKASTVYTAGRVGSHTAYVKEWSNKQRTYVRVGQVTYEVT